MTRRVAWVLGFALALGFASGCGLAAQDGAPDAGPVRVVSSLGDAAWASVQQHLEGALPDVAIEGRRIDSAELIARFVDGVIEVDVFAGVDAQLCELAAADGRLATHGLAEPEQGAFYADPSGRYVAPWAVGWAIVFWRSEVGRQFTSYADLVTGEFGDDLGVPAPRAAPSLWAGWLRAGALRGETENEMFGWLHQLDARVQRYHPTVGHAAAAFAGKEHPVAMLPTDRVLRWSRERGGEVGAVIPQEGVLLTPLAVGVVKASVRLQRARAVQAALLSPELAASLASRHGLFVTGDGIAMSEEAKPYADRVTPWVPIDASSSLGMMQRWKESVSGRGAMLEYAGLALDIVFTLAFFGVAWWIFRSSKTESAESAEPAASQERTQDD